MGYYIELSTPAYILRRWEQERTAYYVAGPLPEAPLTQEAPYAPPTRAERDDDV